MRALVTVVVFVLVSCQVAKLNPGAVAMGLSRLTVRNVAVLTSLIADDAQCGFKSAAVLQGAKLEGVTGQSGTATFTVENCALDFGDAAKVVITDCNGVETKVKGRVTITATRVVEGMLTGNPQNPIIPVKPDAITVTHHATVNGFLVASSDSTSTLQLTSGGLGWVSHPRLAMSKTKGVCAVATRELGLDGVRYDDGSRVLVDSSGRLIDIDVQGSELSAQLGKWGDKENTIEGSVAFWGGEQAIPTPQDTGALDPAYDAAKFVTTYTCNPDLAQPIDRTCPSLQDRLTQGAAQLTVAAFGSIASVIDDDTRCGFASPVAMASARLTGMVGGEGSVTYTLPAPCVQTWAQKTPVKTDCAGVSRDLQGEVSVTGTKTVRGLLTGDPAAPVIPTSRDAAKAVLTMTFTSLTASDSVSTSALIVDRGTLSGELGSRLGLDVTTGACSIKTPVVYFRDLKWAAADVKVSSDGAAYPLKLSGSRLDAQSGPREDHSNWLSGELTVDGTLRSIPVSGPPVLDPAYDEAKYLASFACLPNLKVPANDAECSFKDTLAKNVARLVVQTTGAVASMVNHDTSCGFDNTLNKLRPIEVVGNEGDQGSMKWGVTGCGMRPQGETVIDNGCTGGKRLASGSATVTGTRKVVGERETKLLVIASIKPQVPDAVTLDLTDVVLTEFAAWSVAPGMTAPSGKLVIHTGKLETQMHPILGEKTSEPGRFEIPTPVATFTTVRLTGAYATLESGAKRFELDLPEVVVSGQAGSFHGKSNVVSGRVKVGTTVITVPEIPLDPSFIQAAFDQGYVCTTDLRAVVPPN